MSTSQYEMLYNCYMKIYEKLRELRTEHGLSQKELAELLNIKPNTYSQYECGVRQISLDALIVLADYYNISLDELVGRDYGGKN